MQGRLSAPRKGLTRNNFQGHGHKAAEIRFVPSFPLIDAGLPVLGVTGGEPTLLGADLVRIFDATRRYLPKTSLHVLTNGRAFSNLSFTSEFDRFAGRCVWAVPLYADTARKHNFIVQAEDAFDQTIRGLHNLARCGHRVEIRCVVQRQNADRLAALAEFIYRNAPFVEHVAFMGLEPMGFAKLNRDMVWIDPADYQDELTAAVLHLQDREIAVSIYNLPHCTLSRAIWPFARQSISDWKNRFAAECDGCSMKSRCCGFFKSAGHEWRSRQHGPLSTEVMQ